MTYPKGCQNMKIFSNLTVFFMLCFFAVSPVFAQAESGNLEVNLGENIRDIETSVARVGATLKTHSQDMFVVTDLKGRVNGISPTELLLSLDRQKNVMIIGYFFPDVVKQQEAILQLAPFPVPFKDGYGAAYNGQYIINASPQSGSFLVSVIDRAIFAQNSSSEERSLIKNIDASYFSRSRPSANSDILIVPGDTLSTVVKAIQGYGAKYTKEPNGDLRATMLAKTLLSAWVSEIYVVMNGGKKAIQVFYQFREDSEGVRFASKLPVIKSVPPQLKLLKSKARFAAVLDGDLFILSSPQDGEYRVVLMGVQATRKMSERSYEEILKTAKSAQDLEKFKE